jgi:hypothetical protein
MNLAFRWVRYPYRVNVMRSVLGSSSVVLVIVCVESRAGKLRYSLYAGLDGRG